VLDTIADNFGSYAGDGIGDDWQVQYSGVDNMFLRIYEKTIRADSPVPCGEQRSSGKSDARLQKPRKRWLPTVHKRANPALPTRNLSSLNHGASRKQFLISSSPFRDAFTPLQTPSNQTNATDVSPHP
jgi:hypothetical protein